MLRTDRPNVMNGATAILLRIAVEAPPRNLRRWPAARLRRGCGLQPVAGANGSSTPGDRDPLPLKQMLLALADAHRLNEAGSIAALIGVTAIYLVIELR